MNYPKEDFLKKLTQPENVYLLGMLWADGYVDKKYQIELCLKAEDFDCVKPLIEKYEYNKFKYSHKKYKGKVFGKLRGLFKISNADLNLFLRSYDYREKSSVSPERILKAIPNELKYLWWRGYFDGDGCFYSSKTLSNKFTIWGTYDQDWKCIYNLYDELKIENPIFKQYERKKDKKIQKSSCVMLCKKTDIKKIGDFIYSTNLEFGIRRKYEKYIEIFSKKDPPYKKLISNKKGVYFCVWSGKWISRKYVNGKRIVVGKFTDYELACKALDAFKH